MKTLQKIMALILTVGLVLTMSCKDDTEDITPQTDTFETLTTYLVENNMDIPDVINNWIVGPPAGEADVPGFISSYYIMDLRSATDFADGHIEGAVNSNFSTLIDDAAASNKPILIVCYTGQNAGHAVLALRLSGYSDAKVLKWGMSGWNSGTMAPWNGNVGSNAAGNQNWTTGPVATNARHDYPTLTSTATTGEEILRERVQLLLSNGFQGVNNSDVLENPSNFFINNFWAQTDVDHYGHIAGAYRIQPLTIANDEIAFLDPAKPIVSYCWTGQTSSMLTAYLNVLGYDAKSLKFGANGMIYNNLESHKYSAPSVDLPVVTE
jgi:rhodanese-related sulfurtransferase